MSKILCSREAFLYVQKMTQFHHVQPHIQLKQICQAGQQWCVRSSAGH